MIFWIFLFSVSWGNRKYAIRFALRVSAKPRILLNQFIPHLRHKVVNFSPEGECSFSSFVKKPLNNPGHPVNPVKKIT